MMDPAKKIVQEAALDLQEGKIEQALSKADQAVIANPKVAEPHILRGIALSQLGRRDEATQAFQEAVALEPQNSKAHYNFAVHLFSLNEVESLSEARLALECEPGHQSARHLVERLGGAVPREDSEALISSGSTYNYNDYRPGYHEQQGVLGAWWTYLGWGIAAFGAAFFLIIFILSSAYFASHPIAQVSFPSLLLASKSMQAAIPTILFQFSYLFSVAAPIYIAIDLANRKTNPLWLAFGFLCVCGYGFIPLALYLALGRKQKFLN
jgi:tetratricopeptide (TPR) repeat protein